jgi:hypothetical protein
LEILKERDHLGENQIIDGSIIQYSDDS